MLVRSLCCAMLLTLSLAAGAQDDPEIAALQDQVLEAAGLEAGAPLALLLPGDGAPPGSLSLVLPRAAWRLLETHHWPGNVRELSLVLRNLVTFTLVSAADAVRGGLRLSSARLQVDPALVGTLLAAAPPLVAQDERPSRATVLRPAETLNAVARDLERQAYEALFLRTGGDFQAMAIALLDDPERARAVRLRFNQLGLKVRDLRRELP